MENITNLINSNLPRISENRLLTEEQKWTIVFMKKYFSLTHTQISDCLSLGGNGTVSKIWKKYKENGTVQNLYENCHGKRKINSSDIEILEQMISNNPTIHLGEMKKNLKKINRKEISKSTISTALKKNDFFPMKPVDIPKLTEKHKENRIQYCLNFINDKFSNVIFTDEVFFQLHNNNEIVWFRKTEDSEMPTYNKSNDRKSLKIWGAISRKKIFDLISFENNLNWEAYLNILNDNDFIDQANKSYGIKKWRFMQDGASCHRKKEVIEFIKSHCSNIIDHPSCSPDLNPIEHVWGWMKRKLSKYKIEDHEQLKLLVYGLWKEITPKKINKYIDHHVNKLQLIIDKKGKYLN